MARDVAEWFAKALVALAEAYPAFRLREGVVRVYDAILGDLAQRDVLAAIARAPREFPHFFPSAGELRSLVETSGTDRAVLAWSGLSQAAEEIGAYQSLVCDDPYAALALQQVCGSWPAFCALEQGPAQGTKRQEYLAAYREARRQVQGGPVRLPGLLEAVSRGWQGRLTLTGAVVAERRKALGAEPVGAVKRLTG